VAKRESGAFDGWAMTAIILRTKLSARLKLRKKNQILGKVSGCGWAIEYQKRDLPHAHLLFWTDLDTLGIRAAEVKIRVRYPKDFPLVEHEGTGAGFRQLIDSDQTRHYSKRYRSSDTKYRSSRTFRTDKNPVSQLPFCS
jgi:hypothetical protein